MHSVTTTITTISASAAPFVAVATSSLFAQAQADPIIPGTPNTITGAFILAYMSLVGVIVWLLRHLFLTTIPGIHADAESQRQAAMKRDEAYQAEIQRREEAHQSEMAATRDKHERMVEGLCKSFKDINDSERRTCDERHSTLHAGLVALTSSVAQIPVTMAAAVNEHTTKAISEYRHAINDMLQQAVLGKELYLEKKKREALEETERLQDFDNQRRGLRPGEPPART